MILNIFEQAIWNIQYYGRGLKCCHRASRWSFYSFCCKWTDDVGYKCSLPASSLIHPEWCNSGTKNWKLRWPRKVLAFWNNCYDFVFKIELLWRFVDKVFCHEVNSLNICEVKFTLRNYRNSKLFWWGSNLFAVNDGKYTKLTLMWWLERRLWYLFPNQFKSLPLILGLSRSWSFSLVHWCMVYIN